jgi:hypothetical protein
VFPLVPGGKAPAVKNWEHRAATDPDRIRHCWTAGAYNIGLATGPAGLVVIDLDMAKTGEKRPDECKLPGITSGLDVLAVVAERAGQPLPLDTYTVTTPSGGLHLYFAAPSDVELRNTAGDRGGSNTTRSPFLPSRNRKCCDLFSTVLPCASTASRPPRAWSADDGRSLPRQWGTQWS